MGTSSRKANEVRQREQMLLRIARQMLIENGFAGLNLDRLAEATEYSKGTIYQHFSTKEDLVAALALQSKEARFDLFHRASQVVGTTRERLLAFAIVDELFGRLHPHYYRSELIIQMAKLDQRASPARCEALLICEGQILDELLGVIREAVAVGDLPLDHAMSPEQVGFALFCLSIGGQVGFLNFESIVAKLGIDSPGSALEASLNVFLDGLGWKPLRSEWDYAASMRRISQEFFADEFKQLDAD